MQFFTGSMWGRQPASPTLSEKSVGHKQQTDADTISQTPSNPNGFFNMTMRRQPATTMGLTATEYEIQTISSNVSPPTLRRSRHRRSKSMGATSLEMEPYDQKLSSPSESFYSITEMPDWSNGVVNQAYAGSTSNIHQPTPIPPPPQVYREQYWTWSCQLRSWSKREKFLASIIIVLVLVSFSLGATIGVLFQKTQDGTFSLNGGALPIQPWMKDVGQLS